MFDNKLYRWIFAKILDKIDSDLTNIGDSCLIVCGSQNCVSLDFPRNLLSKNCTESQQWLPGLWTQKMNRYFLIQPLPFLICMQQKLDKMCVSFSIYRCSKFNSKFCWLI